MQPFFLIATLLFLLGFSAHALMASLTLHKRNRVAKDFVFFSLMVTASIWYLANLIASLNGETLEISGVPYINLFFAFSYSLVSFCPALILHLICLLTLGQARLPRWLLLAYLPCLPLAVVPLVSGISPGSFSLVLLIYFIIALALYFLLYGTLAGLILFKRQKNLDIRAPRGFRQGLYYIRLIVYLLLLGAIGVVFYTPGWSYFFLMVKFSILLLSLVMSLYLLRYNFMDTFVKKGIIYSVVSGAFLLIYLLVIRIGGRYMTDSAGIDSTALEILFLFLLILLFQPLTQYLHRFIDRVFYRERSEYREALRNFAQSLQGRSDRKTLCRSVLTEILQAMKVPLGGIGLLDNSRLLLEIQAKEEPLGWEQKTAFLSQENLLFMADLDSATPTEEISERSMGNRLLQAGIKIIIPIRVDTQFLGIIFLGMKRSEEIYFKEDLDLLDAVSSHFGLALENLSLMEKKVEMERQIYHNEKLASIGELAASVAHEIRNPMAGIKCLVQQMDEETPTPAELKEHTQVILEEIGRLERIITQLLVYSKKEHYNFERIPLNPLLHETIDQFKLTPECAGLRFDSNLDTSVFFTKGDREKLRQVFTNILINAAQAFSNDVSGPQIHITVAAANSRGPLVVSIEDNGRGIEPGDLERVFDPFFTRKEKGTGLGLAICSKIIEAHGGEIQIMSRPEKGTKVKILLPLSQGE